MPNTPSAAGATSKGAPKTMEEIMKLLPDNPMQMLVDQIRKVREDKRKEKEKEENAARFLVEEQKKVMN